MIISTEILRGIIMNKKSTFQRLMENEKWKTDFEKGYEEFLLSEFLIEMMEEKKYSVRDLAKMAGVSPTTVQNIRTGTAENVKLKTIINILNVLGCHLKLERNIKAI
jgi:DNA-binding Xre family transcriptional regulator